MRLQWIAMLAVTGLMATACSSPVELDTTQETAILVDDLQNTDWPADHIMLDSASVTPQGRLRLFMRYGGGCRDHTFALLVSRAFMESQPPVLRARIAHDANGDMCKALIQETLEVNLQPVRQHYENNYGAGAASLVLDIDGQRVTYAFQ